MPGAVVHLQAHGTPVVSILRKPAQHWLPCSFPKTDESALAIRAGLIHLNGLEVGGKGEDVK
jgi:hypothetical protein